MPIVFPDYYGEFKCIAERCSHNCCIGWEIDIDDKALEFYRSQSGDFGERLRANISNDEPPHFILQKNERCPFLNDKNLCDIITVLGEEHLCGICADHPRFRNELPDRTEMGLGLSCEEAARIIITRREKVCLLGATETDDEIIILRDEIIKALQNREKDIFARVGDMFSLFSLPAPEFDMKNRISELLKFERLHDTWGDRLTRLYSLFDMLDFDSFKEYMQTREHEYEQFLVYIIYRHFANAPSLDEAFCRACFAAFSFYLLFCLGAAEYAENSSFSTEFQLEIMRTFSAEIEYSDENLYLLIDSF